MILISGCSDKKKITNLEYEEYNPKDFYEVTGRVIENRLSYHTPKTNILFYEYFLEKENPFRGQEENLKVHLNKGEKFIVLVHKKDSTISFFGYVDPRFKKESFEKVRKKANQTFK
ncbi:hypothetical protein [Christiangramia sp. LLG6405-1]|uniref:hypothetical protein n=1 Tax=Christiangramia sp. LLG6405-1 TaxID=3160832 RepID=UPI003862F399